MRRGEEGVSLKRETGVTESRNVSRDEGAGKVGGFVFEEERSDI